MTKLISIAMMNVVVLEVVIPYTFKVLPEMIEGLMLVSNNSNNQQCQKVNDSNDANEDDDANVN